MFYYMYLQNVCHRRHWPDPVYESYRTRQGYFCKVRVNNREYCTDVPYRSEDLAREGAATAAWMICRNFSYNDGMRPGQRPGPNIQGQPVAIGPPSRVSRQSSTISDSQYDSIGSSPSASSDGLSSGSNSPRSEESGFAVQQQEKLHHHQPQQKHQHRQAAAAITATAPVHALPPPPAAPRYARHSVSSLCLCQRAPIQAYGRCGVCLRQSGWT